ncbi:C-type natriuretic peptide 1-like [Bombina bombina]|uniref:C-type natriuretic peptide 1-like n=1 Tax=Bombina bombina TaxID=8345 RepID=UPI00235B1E2C|nr:C-type natriuretic peptide 1-like [Bombina bombina]
MTCRGIACIGFVLILLLCNEQVISKPISSLQSLSRLLEDNFERSFGSEEIDHERGELVPSDSLNQQDSDLQWATNNMDQPDGAQHADISLQQLLNDPLGSSRRYRMRSKKGYSRGCFGMKLDRIGSLSGLGC